MTSLTFNTFLSVTILMGYSGSVLHLHTARELARNGQIKAAEAVACFYKVPNLNIHKCCPYICSIKF